MFLMNAPPVVALQTKWGSYGQTRNLFSVCFSESEDDVSGTPITAQVQMIISNLQSEESSLNVNDEYACIMQKNRKGEARVNNGLTTGAKVAKSKECAKLRYSTEFDTEENLAFGPLVLDSDSDDSVDRDIEEAIQEYLKNKNEASLSQPADAECSNSAKDGIVFNKDLQQTERHSMPSVKEEATSNDSVCDSLKNHEKLRCASPSSISSDDSFEQSIRAEIEQFLNEKKQQGTIKNEVMGSRQIDQKVKPEFKLKGMDKTNSASYKQGCKNTLVGKHTELQKTSIQHKSLKNKPFVAVKSFGKDKQICKTLVAHLQNDYKPQCVQSMKMVDESLSNSSSDDGIEEAIQLYQLEKNRKEFNPSMHCDSLQREPFIVKKTTEDSSSNCAVSPSKNATIDASKKIVSRKRKRINSKSTELSKAGSDIKQNLKQLEQSSFPVDKTSKCESLLHAPYTAEMAAELLCAEAILDISKTIMPLQIENCEKPSLENPISSPKGVLPCSENDSSVDSDDGIEQEIQTFLALKAQSANLTPTNPNNSSKHSNPVVGHSSLSRRRLSLTHKRKMRDESNIVQADLKTYSERSEDKSSQETDCGDSIDHLCQSASSLNSCIQFKEPVNLSSESQRLTLDFSGTVKKTKVSESESTLVPVCSNIGSLRGGLQDERTCWPGDKSSSLDSDEDLDAAIKDLLRSKKKFKKRSKDQRHQYRKKVRFGETQMQVLDKFENIKPKEWKNKNPIILKSCLSKPKKDVKENVLNKSQNLKPNLDEKTSNIQVAFQLQKDKPNLGCNLMSSTAIESKNLPKVISEIDDDSCVDSDDSIEQEIRKFLAEKARESIISTTLQKDTLTPSKATLEDDRKYQTQNEILNLTIKPGSRQAEHLTSSKLVCQSTVTQSCSESEQSVPCTGHLDHITTEATANWDMNQSMTSNDSSFGNGVHIFNKTVNNPGHSKERVECAPLKRGLQNNPNAESDSSCKCTFQVQLAGSFLAGLKEVCGKEADVLIEGQTSEERDARGINPLTSQTALTDNWKNNRVVQSKILSLEKDKEINISPFLSRGTIVSKEEDMVMTEKSKEKTGCLSVLKQVISSPVHFGRDPLINKDTHFMVKSSEQHPAMLAVVKGDRIIQDSKSVCTATETDLRKNSSFQMRYSKPEGGIIYSEKEITEYKDRDDQKEEQGQEDEHKADSMLNSVCIEEKKSWREKGKVSNLISSSRCRKSCCLTSQILQKNYFICCKRILCVFQALS
ncbi:protein phosphatase 1 regulatory subunit 26 isoform X2 [Microcaecilia unicolor]|uniref:Protein phosphatase 1 regulatory subunit 26 isoform X2 n=1 Tax=Microcaecilia unicolor TaxID=1415580 RepID=A0A6P7YKA8_9AMPH|nr:protein phosphatase 1 regulatory subunit 26 isoform X2 [Microcaecilia unicolor]